VVVPAAPPDSIKRLGPDEAYQRATALLNAGHSDSSLPYFRHALGVPGEPAVAHVDYSTALHNVSLMGRSRLGLKELATRSSLERVALMRESLSQLAGAERTAATPSDRALVHATRAHHLLIWGMPWEALVEFRKAQSYEPSWSTIADGLAMRLHHPDRPDPFAGLETGAAPGRGRGLPR
jgi:hypothetical protein